MTATVVRDQHAGSARARSEMHTDETVAEIPVLEMIEPLHGFPDHHRFALARLDDAGLLCALRSLEDPQLRFLVVPPVAFFEEYAPEIDDSTAGTLQASTAEDVLVLVLLNPGESLAETTANLLAPVLVNTTTRRALQVVLADDTHSLRAPLVT